VDVKGNQHVSAANVRRALPSLRSNGVPRAKKISKELKLANENPARQLNVVLKAGEKDDKVDANVEVSARKPGLWSVLANNGGTVETGRNRIGLAFRYANVFDADHVANLQYLTSVGHADRVRILGGSYNIPLYQRGDSMEIFGGYSNVNSVTGGGLSNFQGGGVLLGGRYNFIQDRIARLDSRVSVGIDWRDFRRIEMTMPIQIVMYKEIVTTPLSLAYSGQARLDRTDFDFNLTYARNVAFANKGKSADFVHYDNLNGTLPKTNFQILRYGANVSYSLPADWQLRFALNGQRTPNILIQGEQMRLGGADGVRGFTEGSEGGESAMRMNLESYLPGFALMRTNVRPLIFYDFGSAQSSYGEKIAISSAGIGIRGGLGEQFSMRLDAAKIIKAGNDPTQLKGQGRIHLSLTASF
jgi:hemolysin activation/secretion protein